MATQRSVFDLIETEPQPKATAKAKTVFDGLSDEPAKKQPTVFDSLPTEENTAAFVNHTAPDPDIPTREFVPPADIRERPGTLPPTSRISNAPGEFTSLLKHPLDAMEEARREQWDSSVEAVKQALNPPPQEPPKTVGEGIKQSLVEKLRPLKAAVSLLGAATSAELPGGIPNPLPAAFNLLGNVGRTTALELLRQKAPDVYAALVQKGWARPSEIQTSENISHMAIVAGPNRPTTGGTVFDTVADVASGFVPLPGIPVARITKLLRLGKEAEPMVQAAAESALKRGIPNEERALVAELGKQFEFVGTQGADAGQTVQVYRDPATGASFTPSPGETPEQAAARVEQAFAETPKVTLPEPRNEPLPYGVTHVGQKDVGGGKFIDLYQDRAGEVFTLQPGETIAQAAERTKKRLMDAYNEAHPLESATTPPAAEALPARTEHAQTQTPAAEVPAPVPTLKLPQGAQIEPEVIPLVEESVDMRLKEIEDVFSSELGSLSGKGKNLDTSGYNASAMAGLTQRDTGFGKMRVKSIIPEVRDFKEGPSKIAEAIRRDKDNKLYLRVKEAVTEGVVDRHTPEIEAANEAAIERRAIQGEADGTVFDNLIASRPVSVGEFSRQASEVVAAQREATKNEIAQTVINAPESRVSKRELLGLKKPGIGEVSGPLFPEEKPKELFGSTGAYVSSRTPPESQGAAAPLPAAPRTTPVASGNYGSPGAVLEEAERILTPPPEPSIWNKLKAVGKKAPKEVQTQLVSEFTPLRDLERNVLTAAGKEAPRLDLARKFEQVAGAPAKAQADVLDFRKAVVDPVRDVADDFNTYLFLKRTENRLETDPIVKKVGDWTSDKARVGLGELRAKVGEEAFTRMEAAGARYQEEMNRALELQVKSGRMSQEVYDRIRASNDFYARFKVMKYMNDAEAGPAGTGRNIATTSDLTHAISGVEQEDLHIGNILQASAEQIVKSRILAEKNLKMLELDKLAAVDKGGEFVKRAQPTRYYRIEYKPAEEILKQLGLQQTARNPQVLEQSFIKVGKAIQYADEVGLKVSQKNLPKSLGRATLGGVESGGKVSLNAFTSEVISHELGHSFDVKIGSKLKNVFGQKREVAQRLSSAINEGPKKAVLGQNEYQKELSALVDYTGLGGNAKYRASAKERFAEFIQLYIHNPAKARELAPSWTDHFETQILPNHQVNQLVEKLSKFYQKVDSLPNILTPLKELDDANYLELAIRRAFPTKAPQIGVRFGTKPAPGNDIVNFFRDGKEAALEVSKPVAQAIEGLNGAQTGWIAKTLSQVKVPLQWGATSANAAFQVVNLLFADLPRAALVSRYGLRSIKDVYQFPLDWAYSLFTSMKGNFGRENLLFMEWLRSGAANSTIQRELTPGAFKETLGLPRPIDIKRVLSVPREAVLDNVAKFSNAIEETSKILGLKRGLRIEGVKNLSPEATAAKIQEIAAEVRNYSGSPDFLRKGNRTTSANLLFMFFNARMQGAAADLTRLAGKTGSKEAGAAWARLSAAVGVPATILALVNQTDKYRADYEKIPQWERQNYFMIPRDSFFVNDNGERIREYYRVPKREIVSIFANLVESAVEFAHKTDLAAFGRFAVDALETLSPLNIQGKTWTERLESIVGSANPLVKVPIEQATGRDTFRHQNIIPDYMKNAPADEQYRTTTPPALVKAAHKLGISPLRLASIVESTTGGGITQFTPGRAEVGRSPLTKYPVLKRFVRSGSLENEDAVAQITEAEQKETGAAVRRRRDALDIVRQWREQNTAPAEQRVQLGKLRRTDPKLAEKVKDLADEAARGITYQDKQVLALGVESGARALYIAKQLAKLSSENERRELLKTLRRKRILTEHVQAQLNRMRPTN